MWSSGKVAIPKVAVARTLRARGSRFSTRQTAWRAVGGASTEYWQRLPATGPSHYSPYAYRVPSAAYLRPPHLLRAFAAPPASQRTKSQSQSQSQSDLVCREKDTPREG